MCCQLLEKPKVVLLAGGVGGAKMAEGLAGIAGIDLKIIGNIADDEAFHGLWVSPDIDTLTYSLAGVINRQQGWGLADEGDRALTMLKSLGADTWMFLGDKDFGLHIYRTARRAKGDRPSQIAADIATSLGVSVPLLLPTDDVVQTRVQTDDGSISFQEYFVKLRCAPEVRALSFEGVEQARPTSETLAAIEAADLIVFAPSNPLVSIGPILAIPGIKEALLNAPARKIAVSPIIAGGVVKGPADRMMASLGLEASALGIARHYARIIDALVIDRQDADSANNIEALGIAAFSEDILMRSKEDKIRLAHAVLDYGFAMSGYHVEALP
ncbi:2-phospho-L-lactate transferase [Pseudovibrio sp. SPO723]|uniref:2-phospho-L-lactate transferase n=1 Tax=Nesiotobacter zosterae TaxID=392721 RepID=UPI0029C24924|nr:2-phospho-L-lactate transferase [Pseudovibrio sp. SPO723]MDX5594240.1 2-phospho-L-lactate transferase [Pseudovibrio sp. SPO723]